MLEEIIVSFQYEQSHRCIWWRFCWFHSTKNQGFLCTFFEIQISRCPASKGCGALLPPCSETLIVSEACHTHVYDHHLHFYAHFMLVISISMWCVTVLIQWDIRDYIDHLDELTLVLKELYDTNTEWWSTDELWRCSGFEWSWVNNSDRNNDNNNRWILELFVRSHVSGLVHERAVPKLMVFKQVVHQPMSLRWNQPQQQLLRRNTPIYVGEYAELLNYLAIEWSG